MSPAQSAKISEAIERVAAELLAGQPETRPRPASRAPASSARVSPAAASSAPAAPPPAAPPPVPPAPAAAAPASPAPASPAPELKGHIDALGNGRVFGWAWCPSDPQARLEVTLFAGETEVARGIADKARIDLRRNGIGDGAHAFDLAIPETAEAPVRIVARHASNGETIELRLPGEDGDVESAASSPFGIALDRLDFLIARHRQLQTGHGSLLRQIKELGDKFGEPSPVQDSAVIELETRINQFDVVLDRIDRTLADFETRLQVLTRKNAHGVAPQLLMLGIIVGVLIGVAVTIGFGI